MTPVTGLQASPSDVKLIAKAYVSGDTTQQESSETTDNLPTSSVLWSASKTGEEESSF